MDLGLTGKVALITGGSAGIGLACARVLHAEGVNVALVARDEARLRAAASLVGESAGDAAGILTIAGDLVQAETAPRAVRATLDRFGRLDILINNAGSARAGALLDLDDAAYLDAWRLKLLGYIRMVRAVAPTMIAQGDGRIINIIGGAGRTPSPTFLAGSTANAALINFTRGVSKQLAAHGIRVVAISPGSTATERAQRLAEQQAAASGRTVEEVRAATLRAIPLGRQVAPEEIAAMAAFAASERVPSLTGAEIILDGGQTPGI